VKINYVPLDQTANTHTQQSTNDQNLEHLAVEENIKTDEKRL